MIETRLHDLALSDLSDLIRSREISPVDVVEDLLARIDLLDPRLQAYEEILHQRARADATRAADEIARGTYRGPLHGIPLAVKAMFDVTGRVNAAGMTLRSGEVATQDAAVVTRLRQAGAVLLGTLRMTEGAYFEHHPEKRVPVNPWGVKLWSGASSSGPAVAVAAGLSMGSIGSDTGGSIRFPAAMNGITGLKPSFGRVSRFGAFPAARSLDHLGPLARTARDTGLLLNAVAGADHRDPVTAGMLTEDFLARVDAGMCGVRIGVDSSYNEMGVDEPTVRALREAAEAFSALGADVVAVRMPGTDAVTEAWGLVCSHEAAWSHRRTFPAQRSQYGALAEFLDAGLGVSTAQLDDAAAQRSRFGRALATVFEDVDLLLVPTQPQAEVTVAQKDSMLATPGQLGEFTRFATPSDMTGHPTLTVPGGRTRNHAPVSFQLVGQLRGEALLVRAGEAFQSISSWHAARPRCETDGGRAE